MKFKKTMSKEITFRALNKYDHDIFLKPYPASSNIPDWFKDATPYNVGPQSPEGKNLVLENKVLNSSFKKCTPMLDSLTAGYIIPLWSDVLVTQSYGFPRITWRTGRDIFEVHGEGAGLVTTPFGYQNYVFRYLNTWIPITPPGYSCLITSPFGHKNLPFHAITGIVDTDKSRLDLSNPGWIKNGFEGVIEKGTPIVQVIPFKRDNWKAEFDYYEDSEFAKVQERTMNSTIVNHYIKNVWSKKSFK